MYDSHTSVHYVDLELAGDFLMEYIADGKDIAKCCQNQKFHFTILLRLPLDGGMEKYVAAANVFRD